MTEQQLKLITDWYTATGDFNGPVSGVRRNGIALTLDEYIAEIEEAISRLKILRTDSLRLHATIATKKKYEEYKKHFMILYCQFELFDDAGVPL